MIKRLKYLRPGAEFADGWGNQRFRLLDIVPHPRRPKSRLWRVECIESAPGPRGPVMSAFFASPGLVLYLTGNQEVTPL
jgi:hypothetical protein